MQPEAQRRAACCELVSEVAQHTGEVRLKLLGSSMLPAMWPGDLVTVRRCNLADLRPGHIVLFRADGNLIAHRVLSVLPSHLITRGDSIPRCDSPVGESAIVGQVAHIVRNHRAITVEQHWHHRILSAVLRRSGLSLRILLRLNNRFNAREPQPREPQERPVVVS